MHLLIDGTLGSDISAFLIRLQQESSLCAITPYKEWITHALDDTQEQECHDSHESPDGIIFLRVMPEIAYKRLISRTTESLFSLDVIKQTYKEKEELFIENKNNPLALQKLPVLVLNGNIDFQTDFAQFYNHLFYVRRFIKQIQERKEIALGIYKEKAPQHKCC